MKYYYYYFLLAIFSAVSCKKEAKVKLPVVKPVPVVYCYLCPNDSLIRVKVNYSIPLFEHSNHNSFDPVSNAVVRISSNQNSIIIPFNNNTKYYEISTAIFPVLYGTNYQLSVNMSDGTMASAQTSVPSSNVLISNSTCQNIENQLGSGKLFKLFFNDPVNSNNFYRMAIVSAQKLTSQTDTTFIDSGIIELLSDINYNGTTLSMQANFFSQKNSDSLLYHNVYLINCSKEYYNFHKSLLNYTGDSPFSEPSLTYTNVKNGFGCFGAFTRDNIKFLP